MAYLLINICTQNLWNSTIIVEIIVGGSSVVSFFETQCRLTCSGLGLDCIALSVDWGKFGVNMMVEP